MDTKRVAIYARVSTKDRGQDVENQVMQLREYCHRRGWDITHEYIDQASAKSGDRTRFQHMFTDASQRKFDIVLFWSLDRFSREGVVSTLNYLERLTNAGVAWKSFTEEYLESCGIFKDAVLAILAVIAKQERVRISERTMAGLEVARRAGRVGGRRRAVFSRDEIVRLRSEGRSIGQIAKTIGISKTAAARALKEPYVSEQLNGPMLIAS